MTRYLALFGALGAAFVLFYASVRTPGPAPADAPASAFSAGRAMVDIAAMAPAPHPIGSPANHKVRDYLLQRMTALGLNPVIQRDTSLEEEAYGGEPYLGAGEVENVIGVLPGRDRSLPAVALMAHYDSVPGSPGAADNITGVATALEAVRAIKTGGVPARDVMVVINDGEEAGLLGARAFFGDNPLAAHVGFILTMDTRGGGGRTAMFETGANNGGAIDLYRRTARHPDSNSLAVFVYKLMPNDTDYTVAKAKGIAGLNYAFIGRQFDYHSPSSTVTALDQGSVQNIGEQLLPAARALAFSPSLPKPSADAAYGDLLGLVVLAYPAWAGWLVLLLAGGLIAVGASAARRAKALSVGGVAGGFAAGLALLISAALLLFLARITTGVPGGWMGYRPLLARFAQFEVGMALAGLATLLLLAWAIARRFPAQRGATWIGLLIGGWIAALALQLAAPTITPVIAWPLTLAAASAAITLGATSERRWAWAGVVLVAILSLAWLGGLFHTLLQGLDLPELPALIVWLAAFSLGPLAWPSAPERRWSPVPGAAALVLSFGVMAWLHLTSPWSPRYPRAVEPRYLVEATSGRAWRISPIAVDAWMLGVLRADGGDVAKRRFPTLAQPVTAAPAKPVALPPPAFTLSRAEDGTASLTVAPAPGTNGLRLDLRVDAPLSAVTFDGRPVALLGKPGQPSHLIWYGSDHAFAIGFKPTGAGRLSLEYAEQFPTWPSAAMPPPSMPANDMAWDRAGVSLVTGAQRLTW